jgi:hypothetical protein
MAKNVTNQSPLNSRLKSRLNLVFSKNNRLKRYLQWAWTPLLWEPNKRITKWANGARIVPGIPHLLGIGINTHTIRILVVSDILMDPM